MIPPQRVEAAYSASTHSGFGSPMPRTKWRMLSRVASSCRGPRP